MNKTDLYLDTSIPSAYFGYNKPIRQLITQKWFENEIKDFQVFISTLTVQEIEQFKNTEKRNKIFNLVFVNNVKILEITQTAKELAMLYIEKGAIPKNEPEDALHIAIASVNNISSLASWNFKHIVSINPIKKIHEINAKNKYGLIEIGSLEVFGGYKYGNL